MPHRRSRVILLLAALSCAVLYTLWCGLSNWLDSSNFGKEEITLEDGSKVYVVREQWGLHFDQLSVTRNPDGCVAPNPATDYIDTYGDGQTLVFSVTRDGLILYEQLQFDRTATMHEPTTPWSDVKVSVQMTRAWSNMFDDPRAFGVRALKVPLNNEMCWKNFFRKPRKSPM